VPGFAQQRDEMLSHYSCGACQEYSHVKLTNPLTDRTYNRPQLDNRQSSVANRQSPMQSAIDDPQSAIRKPHVMPSPIEAA
jgi:hypothetical protein